MWLSVKCFIFSVDACIYNTCAFLIVVLILMYAFIVLVLLKRFFYFYCKVDVDADNVQRRELVTFYGV